MAQREVFDAQRAHIETLPPGKKGDRGGTAKDNRLFLEAILWRMRTDAPRRDIPEKFGNWNAIHKCFRRWVKSGVFKRIREGVARGYRLRMRDDRWHDRQGSPEGARDG